MVPIGNVWFWTLFLLSVRSSEQAYDAAEEEIISKHNYGFLWKREQKVWLTMSHSKLVFYYTLPTLSEQLIAALSNKTALILGVTQ